METLEKTQNVYVYTQKELQEKINKTIDKIKRWSDIMDYRIVGDIDVYKNIDIKVGDLSKNQLKKINKYVNYLNKKMTMRKVNSFLYLLSKTFEIKKAQIKRSLKEEKIQKARKEWIKARDESEKLLQLYKDEKGDYYKNKLNFKL